MNVRDFLLGFQVGWVAALLLWAWTHYPRRTPAEKAERRAERLARRAARAAR